RINRHGLRQRCVVLHGRPGERLQYVVYGSQRSSRCEEPGLVASGCGHGVDYVGCLEPKLSLSNIQTDLENLAHLSLFIGNSFVCPEYPDPLAIAQHVFIDTESVATWVVYDP